MILCFTVLQKDTTFRLIKVCKCLNSTQRQCIGYTVCIICTYVVWNYFIESKDYKQWQLLRHFETVHASQQSLSLNIHSRNSLDPQLLSPLCFPTLTLSCLPKKVLSSKLDLTEPWHPEVLSSTKWLNVKLINGDWRVWSRRCMIQFSHSISFEKHSSTHDKTPTK